MSCFVALLHGINVGGKNLIKMSALQACFEAQGFRDVATCIQSGNVLFTADSGRAGLVRRIEDALAARFRYAASVVVRSRQQMRQIVTRAPKGFGEQPTRYRYDVLFLKEPLTAVVAMRIVALKEGVEEAYAGRGGIYFSRLMSKATQSRLGKVVVLPIYKSMTIRNWNTTTALLRLMEERAMRAHPEM